MPVFSLQTDEHRDGTTTREVRDVTRELETLFAVGEVQREMCPLLDLPVWCQLREYGGHVPGNWLVRVRRCSRAARL